MNDFVLTIRRDEFLAYDELEDVIISVAIVPPKRDVFVDRYLNNIQNML